MACNIVNLLNDFTFESNTLESCKHALGHTVAGDCLNESDWELLYYAPNKTVFTQIVLDILPKYKKLAEILQNPVTAEEWYNKVWGGFLKTRRKKTFFDVYFEKRGESWENKYYKRGE